VDRLCSLGLSDDQRLDVLLDDHQKIADAVAANDEEAAVKAGTIHLSRLDSTIERIRQDNADYFDD